MLFVEDIELAHGLHRFRIGFSLTLNSVVKRCDNCLFLFVDVAMELVQVFFDLSGSLSVISRYQRSFSDIGLSTARTIEES